MKDKRGIRSLAGHRDAWLAVVLIVLAAALFWPVTGYDFIHLDDPVFVQDNPMVTGGLQWDAIRQAFTTVREPGWLPLLWMSYMVDITIWGAGPFGHHVGNILLHALNAGLLFWVLVRLTGSRRRAFFVALLFAWHPLRVESVAWIAARKDVLGGLFFLLALLAYVRYAERPTVLRMGCVFGLLLAGLMSTAILAVLPVVLLLLDWWPLHRAGDPWGKVAWAQWKPLLLEKAFLFGIVLLFSLLNMVTHPVDMAGDTLSGPVRLSLIAPNYWVYLGRIFWPLKLSILYPEHDVANIPQAIVSFAGLLAVTAWMVWRRRRAPYRLVGWLWFLVALFPVIRGVRLGLAGSADRFIYLPSIGLAVAVVWSLAAWAGRFRLRRVFAVGGVCVWLALGLLTFRQLPVWRNSGSVFRHALSISPVHPASMLNYGVWLFDQGRLEEAETCYVRVLEKVPGLPIAIGNLGYLRMLQGRVEAAREVLKPELHHPERHWLVPAAWGMSLLVEQRPQEAIPYFQQVLAGRPGEVGMRIELLRAGYEAGDEALIARQAAMLEEQTGVSHATYASLLPHYLEVWKLGGAGYAWGYFQRLVEQEPDNIARLNNIAWLAATDERVPADIVQSAVGFAKRAVELTDWTNATTLDTWAVARAATGDFAGAQEVGEQALALAEQQGDLELAGKIKDHLHLYRERTPYRE